MRKMEESVIAQKARWRYELDHCQFFGCSALRARRVEKGDMKRLKRRRVVAIVTRSTRPIAEVVESLRGSTAIDFSGTISSENNPVIGADPKAHLGQSLTDRSHSCVFDVGAGPVRISPMLQKLLNAAMLMCAAEDRARRSFISAVFVGQQTKRRAPSGRADRVAERNSGEIGHFQRKRRRRRHQTLGVEGGRREASGKSERCAARRAQRADGESAKETVRRPPRLLSSLSSVSQGGSRPHPRLGFVSIVESIDNR